MAEQHQPVQHQQPQHQPQHSPPATGAPAPAAGTKGNPSSQSSDQRLADDKKKVQEERDQRVKDMAEREKKRGTPTPTQEEADLLKLGHAVELADDGSGPDPNDERNTVKHIGGKPAGEYSTRSMSSKS
jgi:hypothetical protein